MTGRESPVIIGQPRGAMRHHACLSIVARGGRYAVMKDPKKDVSMNILPQTAYICVRTAVC